MTALEAISAEYEKAKRDYAEASNEGSAYAQGSRAAWGKALTILQAHRGETIERESFKVNRPPDAVCWAHGSKCGADCDQRNGEGLEDK